MTSVSTILADLDSALNARSEEQRATTVSRVTDMFVDRADDYSDEQVGVFDVVLGRLAAGINQQGRVDLSERLADLPKAPHGVVRQLAFDDIGVARPVLTRSRVLTANDLIAVASTRGRDHMLAITERPDLTEPVTDYLVVKGDRIISHALASNLTARFSTRGLGLLVTRAFADETLQDALGHRSDIPQDLMSNLTNATQESARRRLMTKTATAALLVGDNTPKSDDTTSDESAARAAAEQRVRALSEAGQLTESTLLAFASEGARHEAICALSVLARISVTAAEQSLLGVDRDACLVIGRAIGWQWETARALMRLRPAGEQLPHMINRAKSNFESLSPATAQRVLQFMRLKEKTVS